MQLDTQQQEIVYSNEPKIVAIAGAGSGKTRVLTERVKRLLNEGVDAHSIVAITFTNMAADEMKERLAGVPNATKCFIGTIHSYANNIMKGSGRNYNILTDEALIDIYCQFIARYCFSLKPQTYLKYVDFHKKECSKNGEVFDIEDITGYMTAEERKEFNVLLSNEKTDKIAYTVKDYIKYNNYITFDELIIEATKYLKDNNRVVTHLLVDEFQDVCYGEFKFFNALQPANIFLCGDPRQGIYGFKGADINILNNIIKSGVYKVYELTNNYRTCEGIVRQAESVLENCKVIGSKATCVRNEPGTFIQREARNLSTTLQFIKQNGNYKSWSILVRSNKDAVYMESQCRMQGIPTAMFKKGDISLTEMRKIMSSDAVKILTVHTAKGLEFDNVILYGYFPLRSFNWKEDPSWEEERRVMYVGMTRAKNTLYLINK